MIYGKCKLKRRPYTGTVLLIYTNRIMFIINILTNIIFICSKLRILLITIKTKKLFIRKNGLICEGVSVAEVRVLLLGAALNSLFTLLHFLLERLRKENRLLLLPRRPFQKHELSRLNFKRRAESATFYLLVKKMENHGY